MIVCLGEMLEISAEFWHCCDGDPQRRLELEAEADAKYACARGNALGPVYDFSDAAAKAPAPTLTRRGRDSDTATGIRPGFRTENCPCEGVCGRSDIPPSS